jgi:hypothetical protein
MSEQWIVLEKALDEYVKDVHERFKAKSDELTDAGLMTGLTKSNFIRELKYLDKNLQSAENYLRHTEKMAGLILNEQ